MPVPLLDDRPVTIAVPPDDESTNEVRDRYEALLRNVQSSTQVLADQFAQINKLTADPKRRAEAMASVKRALARSQDDYDRFRSDEKELLEEMKALEAKLKPDMKPITERLGRLSKAREELAGHVKLLEQIEKEENDPDRKEGKLLLEQAKGLLKEAEVEKAIETYKRAFAKFKDAGEQKALEQLEAQWKPRSDEQAKARDFAYKTYPEMPTEALERRWAEVEAALEKCKGDRWALLKLVLVTQKHRERLAAEGKALKPQVNPDDEKPAKRILELLPKLQKFEEDVTAARAKLE
jgi:chromosome segregation ATPase